MAILLPAAASIYYKTSYREGQIELHRAGLSQDLMLTTKAAKHRAPRAKLYFLYLYDYHSLKPRKQLPSYTGNAE